MSTNVIDIKECQMDIIDIMDIRNIMGWKEDQGNWSCPINDNENDNVRSLSEVKQQLCVLTQKVSANVEGLKEK